MARMTLDDLVTAVQINIPSTEEATVKQAANMFLRRLARKDLFFTRARTTVTTTAPVETTVTVSKGATSVTCTDAAATWEGQVVKFTGSNQWFSIDSVDVGVGFTISSKFDGTSLTDGAADVAFPRIALGADLIDISSMKSPTWEPLATSPGEHTDLLHAEVKMGRPSLVTLVEPINDNDYMEIYLMDFPDAIYTYTIIGKNRLTRFAGTTSKCGLPERYEDVLIVGTSYYVRKGDDPGGNDTLLDRKEMLDGIEEIEDTARIGNPDHGVLAGADRGGGRSLRFSYPSEGAS